MLDRAEEALQIFDECCRSQPNAAYYHWATGIALWNRLAFLPYRNGADKRRFLEAVGIRIQRALELKTADLIEALAGGSERTPRSRTSRQTVKSP
jgi:hypothetical protein